MLIEHLATAGYGETRYSASLADQHAVYLFSQTFVVPRHDGEGVYENIDHV